MPLMPLKYWYWNKYWYWMPLFIVHWFTRKLDAIAAGRSRASTTALGWEPGASMPKSHCQWSGTVEALHVVALQNLRLRISVDNQPIFRIHMSCELLALSASRCSNVVVQLYIRVLLLYSCDSSCPCLVQSLVILKAAEPSPARTRTAGGSAWVEPKRFQWMKVIEHLEFGL
jgi:hypothetical protein